MQVRTHRLTLATIGVVSFTASIAFAGIFGHHHSSSQKSANVDIAEITKVPNGPTLEPGTYKATLVEDSSKPEVEFYQDGKLVGQAPVRLVDQGEKITQTVIDSNKQPDGTYMLTEMDLSGLTQKLMFGTSKASGGKQDNNASNVGQSRTTCVHGRDRRGRGCDC